MKIKEKIGIKKEVEGTWWEGAMFLWTWGNDSERKGAVGHTATLNHRTSYKSCSIAASLLIRYKARKNLLFFSFATREIRTKSW